MAIQTFLSKTMHKTFLKGLEVSGGDWPNTSFPLASATAPRLEPAPVAPTIPHPEQSPPGINFEELERRERVKPKTIETGRYVQPHPNMHRVVGALEKRGKLRRAK